MKKYFIFKCDGNIIVVDIKNIYEDKEGVAIWADYKLKYYTKIEFGSFAKLITGCLKKNSNEFRYEVKPLSDGGFILKDLQSKEKEEYEVKEINIIYNPKEGYIMEFPDDTSVELWVEVMRQDYGAALEKGWW